MSDDPIDPIEPTSTPAEPTSSTESSATAPAPVARKRKQRTSPRQFLREVRSELRKVAWPARKELLSYSLVVLVSVSIITLYITGLDQVFGTLILRIFSS